MARSSPTFDDINCQKQSNRGQLNLLSSYLDGTQIYGSTVSDSNAIRSFVNGGLATSDGVVANRSYLPKSFDQCSNDWNSTLACFKAGEIRTSENLGLTGVQTLFMREHNRIAASLATLNPSWNDQTIFDETRRIVIGIYQHIIYNEWIPWLLGKPSSELNVKQDNKFYKGYDNSVRN